MAVKIDDSDICVFDAHTHLGIKKTFEIMVGTDRLLGDEMVTLMDKHGVDKVISFPCLMPLTDFSKENNLVKEAMEKHPDRIVGFVRVNPYLKEIAIKQIEFYVKEAGMKGIKLHPSAEYYSANDPVVYPILEKAVELKVPVLFHSGELFMARPAMIADLAYTFPDATIIMGHMGIFEDALEAIAVAKRADNIILETSYCPLKMVMLAKAELGPKRIVYGSDTPYSIFGWEIDKILKYSNFKEDEKRLILGENLANLLHIKLTPT